MGLSSTQYTFGVSVLVCCAGIYSLTRNRKNDDVPKTITTVIRKRRSVFPKQYSKKAVDKAVLEEMLEAGRWAPSHKLTEPWIFHVFETEQSRQELGNFLARQYKKTCENLGKTFSQAKYDKKISNALKSSFVVALICETEKKKNPVVEEICSIAMFVQNMLLVAASHEVGKFNTLGEFVKVYFSALESEIKAVLWGFPQPTQERIGHQALFMNQEKKFTAL